ncbi:MAG TPA: DedA family protein [Candidatus Chromulinivoraceae bacterium]|nr:DedA family protein [Candidatus Chromulinivoraceae bacterium]
MSVDPQQIPPIIQSLAPLISHYGYLGVGGLLLLEDFGIPVPGETVLIAAAFYAGLGDLNIFIVAVVAFIGAVLGDNIGFAIGEYGGHPLVQKYGKYVFLTPERLHKAEHFFNHHGGKVVTIARFIEGLRQLNGILAGLSDMRWAKFIVFNALGAALWVGTWSLVGYYSGNHIQTFLHYQMYMSLTVVAALILYILFRIIKRQREANV